MEQHTWASRFIFDQMASTRRTFLTTVGAAASVGTVETAVGQEDVTVEMITEGDEYRFDPIGLHVEPGTTVTFENVSGTHNSVSYEGRIPEGASAWRTPIGETAEHTFEEPGTYDYYCEPHRSLGMVGRIVVGEPGGPASGSMPPDGDVPESGTIVEAGSVSYEAFATGSTGSGPWLLGVGLLGGMTVLAVLVYLFGNSEGERYRVGSPAWRLRHGLER